MSSSNRYNTRPLAALLVAASTFTITTPSVVVFPRRRRRRAHDTPTPRTKSCALHSFILSFTHSFIHSRSRALRRPSSPSIDPPRRTRMFRIHNRRQRARRSRGHLARPRLSPSSIESQSSSQSIISRLPPIPLVALVPLVGTGHDRRGEGSSVTGHDPSVVRGSSSPDRSIEG